MTTSTQSRQLFGDSKFKGLITLNWVVFTDSLGWGIAFSVFAALFFNKQLNILPASYSDSARYILYEFLLSIYSFLMFFFAPFLGGIADRFGRKPGLKVSMAGLTIGFILCALGCYYSMFWFLVVGRIISGMTAGSVSIAQAATVDLSTPQNKSFYLSVLMLCNTLGFSLGPILGSLFTPIHIAPVGTVTFLAGAAMSLIALLGVIVFFKETYTPKQKDKTHILRDFLNIKVALGMRGLNVYLLGMLFAMTAFVAFFSGAVAI